MKIGITERGDASIDYSWVDALQNHTVDGAILITKNITAEFINKVMTLYRNNITQIIVHCTCTGWGGTYMEPCVPNYSTQLKNLANLINCGFPITNCVLRIDPIIPTTEGINNAKAVIDKAYEIGFLPRMRVRVSIYDEYNHVKARLCNIGREPIYHTSLYAPYAMMNNVISELSSYDDITFETCAEDMVASRSDKFTATGCVSLSDINIMGLPNPCINTENNQNRRGCHCLTCKTELLSCRAQCPNGCVYCYWQPTTQRNQR